MLLRTFFRYPTVRTNPITCSAVVAILALPACGGGTEPPPPPPPTTLTSPSGLRGTYIVDLTRYSTFGPSCQQVRVTIASPSSWGVVACTAKIQPGPMFFRGDTILLTFTTTQAKTTPHFQFRGFSGTTDEAISGYEGGPCGFYYGEPVCEQGKATWHR